MPAQNNKVNELRNSSKKIMPRRKNTVIMLGIIFVLSGIFFVLCQYRSSAYKHLTDNYAKDFFIYDKLLGYKPRPNAETPTVRKYKDDIIYNVIYSIDTSSRRITPVNGRSMRNKFALFFGCSFTFGEGVNDDETMPFYAAKYAPSYMPYNYGCSGYGPQNMLAKLQDGSIRKEIRGQDGVLIYVFIDYHIHRAIGSMCCLRWGRNMPYYVIDPEGHLTRKGSFVSGRPFISWCYKVLNRLDVKTYLMLLPYPMRDIPLITDKHVEFTCKIIEESNSVFKEQYRNGEFYVLFYPGFRYANKMIPRLKKNGIACLDYSRLFDNNKEEYILSEHDRHPSKRAYEVIAKKLARDIFFNHLTFADNSIY